MQEKNNPLKVSVRYIKGVGPKKSELLAGRGIETIEDILYYLPARYEDRSNFTDIKDLKVGESQTIAGEVIVLGSRRTRAGIPVFQAAIDDKTGIMYAIWFNQPYLKDYFKKGDRVVLYGRVEKYDRIQFVQPEYEILPRLRLSNRVAAGSRQNEMTAGRDDDSDSIHVGRIVPVYSLTSQLTQRYLRSLAYAAVTKYARFMAERLPTYIIAREKLVDIKFAVRNIHFPVSFQNLEKAYRRIVFDEFFMLQLALAMRKKTHGMAQEGLRHIAEGGLMESFKKSLPFDLTDAQVKAIADIERSMTSGSLMNRLLEGDVGSGKTAVAAYALILTVQNNFQGVLMAPTEVLARQHFIFLSELLMPLGINVVLLIGGIDAAAKRAIYSGIKTGDVDIVVGTHAILQEAVEFKNLGLAVIDEQHKFGVTQRSILKEKGYNPHILVMTATPIPRTLALTVFGDLDISIIRELPKGRKPIATYWVEEEKRDNVYRFMKEELSKGRQAYVICPLIDSLAQSEKRKAKSAMEMYEKLKNEMSGFEIGLLHGRMSSKEKESVMRAFKKGKIQVLVSTIVIEVGIDVPNASIMLIENAERFGLAQLHQLRGRVGRGEHESYCVLLADPRTENASQRLKAIEGTLDGFQIAEADLNIRGPGEFFGTRQHGLPEIRFGNIIKDFDIMEAARREAFALVAKDPEFKEEHHTRLKEAIRARFGGVEAVLTA